jgi:hypothetical protein
MRVIAIRSKSGFAKFRFASEGGRTSYIEPKARFEPKRPYHPKINLVEDKSTGIS